MRVCGYQCSFLCFVLVYCVEVMHSFMCCTVCSKIPILYLFSSSLDDRIRGLIGLRRQIRYFTCISLFYTMIAKSLNFPRVLVFLWLIFMLLITISILIRN